MAIAAVFFDFFQTLANSYPPREQRQLAILRQLGYEVEERALQRGLLAAEQYRAQVGTAGVPAHKQSREERREVFNRYQRIILETAGIPCDYELAEQIQKMFLGERREMRLYPDVKPALEELKAEGYKLGLISNFIRDPNEELQKLGLDVPFDAIVSSIQGDYEKPDPRIFQAGLAMLEVRAEEAVHVGDQLLSDAQGATAAGLKGVLLDRNDLQAGAHPYRICSLTELPALLRNGLA